MSYFTSDLALFLVSFKRFPLPERLAAVFDSEIASCGIKGEMERKKLNDHLRKNS
jgi:hypothetical protein